MPAQYPSWFSSHQWVWRTVHEQQFFSNPISSIYLKYQITIMQIQKQQIFCLLPVLILGIYSQPMEYFKKRLIKESRIEYKVIAPRFCKYLNYSKTPTLGTLRLGTMSWNRHTSLGEILKVGTISAPSIGWEYCYNCLYVFKLSFILNNRSNFECSYYIFSE